MRATKQLMLGVGICLAVAGAAMASEKITTKQDFVNAIAGKDLTLVGIRVNVSPTGTIGGRAYGRAVKGSWQWRDGYFCRDLYWGKRDLGPNCQEVRLHGNKVRFTSDRGAGQYADLTIK